MAYRNGTYVAFHADGSPEPWQSDMKYYNLLRAWKVREEGDFQFVNSHDKTAAVRDTSSRETLRRRLIERLNSSKNMVLIVGTTTRFDTDWVPFEIEYAIDVGRIPLIVVYPDYEYILAPGELSSLWPMALLQRIRNGSAHAIHMSFKQAPIANALARFDHNNYPNGGGLGYYSREAYRDFGVNVP